MTAQRGSYEFHLNGLKRYLVGVAVENDFVSDEEFDRLLDAWFGNIARVLEPGRSFYIWGGYANLGNYPRPLAACDLYYSQGIVWDKAHPVLSRTRSP